MVFRWDTLELVTQTQVEGHALGNSPVVLGVASEKPLRDIPGGIPAQEGSSRRSARKKVFQCIECDASPPSPESALMDQIPANLTAEFDGVIAAQRGNLINEAVDL